MGLCGIMELLYFVFVRNISEGVVESRRVTNKDSMGFDGIHSKQMNKQTTNHIKSNQINSIQFNSFHFHSTFIPFRTNNNSIPFSFHSMNSNLQLIESNRIPAHNLRLIRLAELGNVLLHDIHHLPIFTAQRHHYPSPHSLFFFPTRPIRSHHHAIHTERIENNIQIRCEVLFLPIRPVSFRHHPRHLHKHIRKSGQILGLSQSQRLRECPAPTHR